MERISEDHGLEYMNIPLKPCEELPRFSKVGETLKLARTAGFLCIEDPEMIELAGSPFSSEYQYLNI